MHKFEITNAEGGAALPIRLTLEAQVNKVTGKDNEVIYIDLAVEPDVDVVDQTLVSFLTEKLQVKTGKIAIAAGRSLERKVVIIMGLTPRDIETRLFS